MTELALSYRLPSVWWGAMIICGTIVGAGMFTLPVVMAGAWYSWSIILLLLSWICMLMSGVLFLKVSHYYPLETGYDTLTKKLLGPIWRVVNGGSIAFVLGVLTYAYISASGPVFHQSLNLTGLPISIADTKILLTFMIALVVWLGTSKVSRIMSICLCVKLLLFFLLFGGLLAQVNNEMLMNSQSFLKNESYWPYSLAAIPFCLASFGFHGNITGLRAYYRGNIQQTRSALLIGTLLAVVIYIIWLTGIMGNLPRSDFPEIIANGGDVKALLSGVKSHIHVDSLSLLMVIFSHFAVACSFLGVTTGLFDFIADLRGAPHSSLERIKTTMLTFIPPLAASLLFPDGFIRAIGYAGLLATIWAVITPALLMRQARQRNIVKEKGTRLETISIWSVLLFGAVNITAWLLNQWDLLPVYR